MTQEMRMKDAATDMLLCLGSKSLFELADSIVRPGDNIYGQLTPWHPP